MKSENFFAVVVVGLGAIVLFVATTATSAIMQGWALVHLWHWFVFPVFGVPVPTIPQAIGLCAIAGFLQLRPTEQSDLKKETWSTATGQFIGRTILRPLFTVGFCWLVYQFVR